MFIEDPTIKVIVVDDRKVQYNDNLTSLSAVAGEIKGYNVAGPRFFTYNGKLIADIAEETQWKK